MSRYKDDIGESRPLAVRITHAPHHIDLDILRGTTKVSTYRWKEVDKKQGIAAIRGTKFPSPRFPASAFVAHIDRLLGRKGQLVFVSTRNSNQGETSHVEHG